MAITLDWLCRAIAQRLRVAGQFIPEARPFGPQIQYLLTDPEMQAFLAAAPQAARLIRPLCHMLGGVGPGPDLLLPPPPPGRPKSPPPITPPAVTATPTASGPEPQVGTHDVASRATTTRHFKAHAVTQPSHGMNVTI